MRTVLKSSEIDHYFANQVQECGKCGNVFFENKTIYSYGYHFPMAKHVTNENGENAVLFTTRSYSSTTARHLAGVRYAIDHLRVIRCFRPDYSHEENMKQFLVDIKRELSGLTNARKPEKYIEPARMYQRYAHEYAAFFGIDVLPSIDIAINDAMSGDYKGYLQREAARIEAEEKAKKEKEIKEAKKLLSKWKRGEVLRAYGRINDRDFLRVYNGNIETSQNIKLPIPVAQRIYKTVMSKIANGGCVSCDFKILEYEVREITPKLLTVGCHKIDIKEIQSVAKQLNWVN